MVEEIGQIFVQVRRGHQGDDSLHRVEPYPTEVPVPVHRRERGNGVGVGTQDVDGGAKRPRVHRCGVVHEGMPPAWKSAGRPPRCRPSPFCRGRIADVHRHRPRVQGHFTPEGGTAPLPLGEGVWGEGRRNIGPTGWKNPRARPLTPGPSPGGRGESAGNSPTPDRVEWPSPRGRRITRGDATAGLPRTPRPE